MYLQLDLWDQNGLLKDDRIGPAAFFSRQNYSALTRAGAVTFSTGP